MTGEAQQPQASAAAGSAPSSSHQNSQMPIFPSTINKLQGSSSSNSSTPVPFTATKMVNANSPDPSSPITTTPSLMGITTANDTETLHPMVKLFQESNDNHRGFESTTITKQIASYPQSQNGIDRPHSDAKQQINNSVTRGTHSVANQQPIILSKASNILQPAVSIQTPTPHLPARKPFDSGSNTAIATHRDDALKNPSSSSTPALFSTFAQDPCNRLTSSSHTSPVGNKSPSQHLKNSIAVSSNTSSASPALPLPANPQTFSAQFRAMFNHGNTARVGEKKKQPRRPSHAASAVLSTVAAPSEFSAGPSDDTGLRAPTNTPATNTKRPMTSSAKNSPSVPQPPTKTARKAVGSTEMQIIDVDDPVPFLSAPNSEKINVTRAAIESPRTASNSDVAMLMSSTPTVDRRPNAATSVLAASATSTLPVPHKSPHVSVEPMANMLQSPSADMVLTSIPQNSGMSPTAATDGPASTPSTHNASTQPLDSTNAVAPVKAEPMGIGSTKASASELPQLITLGNESGPCEPSVGTKISPIQLISAGHTEMELDNNAAQHAFGSPPPLTKKRPNATEACPRNHMENESDAPNRGVPNTDIEANDVQLIEQGKNTSDEPRCPKRGDKVSGFVVTSSQSGHRVFANICGQRMYGWLIPVNIDPSVFDEDSNGNDGKSNGAVLHQIKSEENNSSQHHLQQHLHLSPRSVFATNVPKRSVIIIGAGIAGISAARALKDRGFEVVVLEARGRLGGRIATDWSLGSPVELGACFIHGSFGNPLALIAREAALRTYVPSDVDNLFYSNGARVSSAEDQEAEEIWRSLTKRAERLAGNVLQKREADMSLGALLRKLSENLQNRLSNQVKQLLSWHASNLEMACAADLDDLSATHYDMDVHFGFAGPHEVVRDGYSSIVQALAQNLDVRLNTVVKAVYNNVNVQRWEAKSQFGNLTPVAKAENVRKVSNAKKNGESITTVGIKGKDETASISTKQVRYLDMAGKGTQGRKEWFGWEDTPRTTSDTAVRVITEEGLDFTADWCIITVPLGVLQSGDIKFDPPLPQWKQESIERIGFGVVNKVVLRFENAFWVQQDSLRPPLKNGHSNEVGDGVNTNELADDYGTDYIGRVADKHGVFTMFLSMMRITGAPILVGITAGKFAEFLEDRGDEEVATLAVDALRTMYGQRRVGRLLDWRVTRWSTDRFSRGSYSYARVGSTPADYLRMSSPVDRVLFAGEATHRKHPATAHGAFMSGLREAARIVRHTTANGEVSAAERRALLNELALMEEPDAPPPSTDMPKRRQGARSSWRP